jgi:hypothetical protein
VDAWAQALPETASVLHHLLRLQLPMVEAGSTPAVTGKMSLGLDLLSGDSGGGGMELEAVSLTGLPAMQGSGLDEGSGLGAWMDVFRVCQVGAGRHWCTVCMLVAQSPVDAHEGKTTGKGTGKGERKRK